MPVVVFFYLSYFFPFFPFFFLLFRLVLKSFPKKSKKKTNVVHAKTSASILVWIRTISECRHSALCVCWTVGINSMDDIDYGITFWSFSHNSKLRPNIFYCLYYYERNWTWCVDLVSICSLSQKSYVCCSELECSNHCVGNIHSISPNKRR
jgi:hypothetical protein